jgi:hypothetical protein
MLVAFITWIGVALCCGFIAAAKGRTAVGWFILGFMFSIFALIVIAVIPRIERNRGHVAGPINMSGRHDFNHTPISFGRRVAQGLFWLFIAVTLYKHYYPSPSNEPQNKVNFEPLGEKTK